MASKKKSESASSPALPAEPSSSDVLEGRSFDEGVKNVEDALSRSLPVAPEEENVIVMSRKPPEAPRPREDGSFERTVKFLRKRGIDLHDNHDGSYSARFGHQARKGTAQEIRAFCFSHVPHPKNRVWTEADMQEAVERS